MRGELGVAPGDANPPVPESEVELPEARELPAGVVEAAGREHLLTDRHARLLHSAGKSYPDLLRVRTGAVEHAPDAVVVPDSVARLDAIVAACAESGVAVVPFGGGSSVVGGVEALAGAHDRVISLDLAQLRDLELDRTSLTARMGPGLRGPEAEAALSEQGATLGHFPQSFEYATIGGFAATRSAGQASTGYGRFDELVTSLAMVSPAGPISTLATPHTAAGPSLREVLLGSEGTLGVISEVTCRVRPQPEARRYEGWMAESFRAGSETFRELAQANALPDVLRLSDEEETRVSLRLSGAEGLKRRALDAYLTLRRRAEGCVVICGWEGSPHSVKRRRKAAAGVLRSSGAVPLGTPAGASWRKGRFEGPYLRDALMDQGVLVETLETSHTWSRLGELHRAVGEALRAALGSPSIVMCHISHVYPDGASLYFTFLARARPGEELRQWKLAKTAACDAIVASGGTITHHHAVGADHAPYMTAEVGELGVGALKALKERFDPAGVMNPGKLLP